MFKHFIRLEWKSFLRSASFGTNLVLKIIMGLAALYFIACFAILGTAVYFILKEEGLEPLSTVNTYLIYYLVGDLVIRFFLQKMPVTNIKPLLTLPIKRNTIVHYSLGKTSISFFNIIHAFFFLPFTVVLLMHDYGFQAVLWHLGMMALIFTNNFINVLLNNKNSVFYPMLIAVVSLGLAQYYHLFTITDYTQPFFQSFYNTNYGFAAPLLLGILVYYFSFAYFKSNLNLDTGLAKKSAEAKTEDYTWLNQFGTLGTFLKNDIKLLRRNKRSRTTVIMSFLFIFYGLLFFTNSIEAYQNPMMQVFAGIFVSGGFLFTFGQFVPSWDSAYYQLMMSQNISYRQYLTSKWWLMVIGTVIATIIASFYLYFGWQTYMLIVVGAIYNIGVNSHLVMLGGAYVKTPIDLTMANKAFGDKQAFNIKTMLISLPKLLVPMLLYALGYYVHSANLGFLLVALAGVLGFALRDKVFTKIEKIYKTEKYATIAAYKQKN
ncbi:hypothetical protein EZL74_01730 [Flavobacterium silvisoli]|uniref:Uncharacterized protein n=1 Tax=Flavobacterium silvisoli TaxID=2529433 RepID=A0A4Q9Z4N6_9FLAO|nr:DUF5687 family protein [Flavobacterium silvisoli]TBX71252.1 hypothetical protein EZL74_01730 [Flavobacterium silvisoli]